MATTASLSATPRTESGKGAARKLRAAGEVPAVVYGSGREPESLAVNARELEKLLSRISAENTLVELGLGGRAIRTLIREIQRHPFKRHILHVDFLELVAGETVTVAVPLVLVGVPEGVRTGGGVMDQVLRDLSVVCDPGNIPNHIDVDVSEVSIGHSVHVRDLTIPEGVTVLTDADATIVVVAQSRATIEAAAADAEAAAEAGAEPEVIRKAKADDE
jgi:large subunit ribosomal protein L25